MTTNMKVQITRAKPFISNPLQPDVSLITGPLFVHLNKLLFLLLEIILYCPSNSCGLLNLNELGPSQIGNWSTFLKNQQQILPIPVGVAAVQQNHDEVEPAQQRTGDGDVYSQGLARIVVALGVGGRHNGASGVQLAHKTCLPTWHF